MAEGVENKENPVPVSPVAGLGVDIIEIDRMEKAVTRTPRMITRLFSEYEQNYAKKKARPAIQYALFFAAKEAVLKALGTGFAGVDAFTDVEVTHDRYGKPVPVLHGRTKELADSLGIVDMQLSLSYTRSVGVASAVAIKEQDRPKTEDKIDQKAELARKFKELRAMLDEMEPTELQKQDGKSGETAGD
ncbi:MAG TPA: holo-[acyl-carrier-protein] synthase [Coriobacteriia bacterium]|nr:holo-[acyl-carrier-protein] synthase [Coriobacteriia bacterium]